MKPVLFLIAAVLCINGTLSAIPSLQLDIKNGSYSNETETIITNESLFTLYGYGKSSIDISKDYLLSIAIIPSVLSSEVDWGFFTVNDTLEYYVPIDMNFGIPPIDSTDNPRLGKHDVFETFFIEIPFKFSSELESSSYNTEISTGSGPIPGVGMYYQRFLVDRKSLHSDIRLHFDLLNLRMNKGGATRGIFAPFVSF